MASADRSVERGVCTLIVAREGPVQPARDELLLEAVERVARLPAGTLERTDRMDAREFRLVEGISRSVAEEIASVAQVAGYVPRIRDRLGIKWSSERGTEMSLWIAAAAFGFGLLWAVLAPAAAFLFGMAGQLAMLLLTIPLMLAIMAGMLHWQLSRLFMPLVVQPDQLVPVEAGALSEAAHDALDAVGRLRRHLDGGALPSFATEELRPVVSVLDDRVRSAIVEARKLDQRSTRALRQLQMRMRRLDEAADEAEYERLTAEIEQADAAETQRVQAREELAKELLGIRVLAMEAVDGLEADTPDLEAVERLRRLTEAPRAASQHVSESDEEGASSRPRPPRRPQAEGP